ncbi:hypothetical protein [Novosphingobium sp.]|jgi:hypothetical protein|uniref:hypothetical protein n=1 Tax=Novosphingobium sp. TaxID=1874826 RepID=UPI002FE381E7
MHRASLPGNSQPPAPSSTSTLSFVDRDCAVRVVSDLLSGLQAQGGPDCPRMLYAKIQAQKILKAWGA